MLDFRACEVFEAVEIQGTVAARPYDDATARIERFRVGNDQAFAFEAVDVADVGCREQINRRAVFNLLRQRPCRAEQESHLDAGLLFKAFADFFKRRRQVGGSSHRNLSHIRLVARRLPRAAA